MIVLHAVIAIALIVALIIWLKVNPLLSLMIGSLYLGLAGGLGMVRTVEVIAEGFGKIMLDIGLLIGFGVLLGALLFAMGALQKTVELLFRLLGPTRVPYGVALALNMFFPSIYPDVQLVLAAPLARSASRRLGPNGLGIMAGALVVGIPVGVVFVVPGLGAVSIAGLFGVPLGTMLMFGIVVGPLTALITLAIYIFLVNRGLWKPLKDEGANDALESEEELVDEAAEKPAGALPPLGLSILPVLVPLLLIGLGAVANTAGVRTPLIEFLGEPLLAMFLGLMLAYGLALRTIGRKTTDHALEKGIDTTGNILVITGLGGSLAAVIRATDLSAVLAGVFSAEAGLGVLTAVLLAWLIACVLHIAIGSINVAAIAAAGIIAPIVPTLGVAPVVVALAIASGALFAVHFNSNFFWMYQSLLGVTTPGALKSLTFLTCLASVVALAMIIPLALVMG